MHLEEVPISRDDVQVRTRVAVAFIELELDCGWTVHAGLSPHLEANASMSIFSFLAFGAEEVSASRFLSDILVLQSVGSRDEQQDS